MSHSSPFLTRLFLYSLDAQLEAQLVSLVNHPTTAHQIWGKGSWHCAYVGLIVPYGMFLNLISNNPSEIQVSPGRHVNF